MTANEMCQLPSKAWVHATSDILPQGRAVYHNYGWAPPDDKPDAKDPKLEKNRPALQVIRTSLCPERVSTEFALKSKVSPIRSDPMLSLFRGIDLSSISF